VAPDVTESRCAQQCVANSVSQHVAIRVTHRALVKGNAHTAQDQFAVWREPVEIVADSHP
jgi:hypothetical protein